MRWQLAWVAALTAGTLGPARGAEVDGVKDAAVAAVARQRRELIGLADRIWSYAETALRETRSANDLAAYAEQQGFTVEREVAGLPTSFVASFGTGRPIIGILGEYDALPGISQKAWPTKEPVTPGAGGHGCGHNLFGTASLGAAVAVKEQLAAGRLKGTVRFYGCPAEETLIGKVYMARAGLFNDLDVCVAWHPSDETAATTRGTRAMADFLVEFRGRTAHAASDPWNGRSALDGLELLTHGLNMLREHVKPTVRIHYVVADGGKVPNVVPDYARLWCWVRDVDRAGVEAVMSRVRKMVEGAGLMADVEAKLTLQGGVYEMLVNRAGAGLLHANLERLGPPAYTDAEREFAVSLQRASGVEPRGIKADIRPLRLEDNEAAGGSTDVADVSWIVPTLHLNVTTSPEGVPRHAWPVVASSGMSIGHKGMVRAAEVLAATLVDLFRDGTAREAIRAEFQQRTRGFTYKPMIPDGPPPLPKP